MNMIYENDFGKVKMSGDGNDGFSVIDIDGTELLGKERTLVHFNNKDGYDENTAFFGQRVITVSGDITAENSSLIKNAIRVFSKSGTLKIETREKVYEIFVNDCTFKTIWKNSRFKAFCVQMTCDFPHFTDSKDTTSGIYKRKNLITSTTHLPAIFTERVTGGTVNNRGDVLTEPTITIKCLISLAEEGSITLENTTTGKKIIIDHKVSEGEIITIDIPNRMILSNIAGDITNLLSPESYLCDMFLECGENYIDVYLPDGNRNCEAYLTHRNLYAGVLI